VWVLSAGGRGRRLGDAPERTAFPVSAVIGSGSSRTQTPATRGKGLSIRVHPCSSVAKRLASWGLGIEVEPRSAPFIRLLNHDAAPWRRCVRMFRRRFPGATSGGQSGGCFGSMRGRGQVRGAFPSEGRSANLRRRRKPLRPRSALLRQRRELLRPRSALLRWRRELLRGRSADLRQRRSLLRPRRSAISWRWTCYRRFIGCLAEGSAFGRVAGVEALRPPGTNCFETYRK
jgi:hypothetical protein